MKERRYIAISIKHSEGCRFTLWGYRTADDQERCFSGYSSVGDYDKCELYSLEDFQKRRGNGVIKCNESVKMSRDMVEKWNHYDTVLVDYQDYINFLRDELGYVIEEGNQISTLRSIGRKGRNMERDIELIGIKRSVDDLGRVVLPREIRQKLRIREGTSLEIFATTDGVFLKKCYSDSDLSDMVQNLDEAVDVACVDLGVETTGNIREHIREIQRLLKPQK